MPKELTMAEIADWIHLWLKAAESDPKMNTTKPPGRHSRLWCSMCHYPGRGPKIIISYISFQGTLTLSKADALKYMEWLEKNVPNGKFERHFTVLRDS